ncbi:MAG: Lpg1974 family pore-forming outer membrane protein, partial [bacterium]|nr:Lpg1974 family pore-forming outer membrane protein [bacterium]
INIIDLVEKGGILVDTVKLMPKWDDINFEFGQQIKLGVANSIRFFGGAQYARLKTTKTEYFFDSTIDPSVSRNEVSNYSGFGPRVGLDMSYELNHLSLYTNMATALLIGKNKYYAKVEGMDSGGASGGQVLRELVTQASNQRLVPEFEAKLGLNYTYLLSQSNIIFDMGYLWVNYFKAHTIQSRLDFSNNLLSNSDFSMQGPYAGLKWVGSIA